MTSARANVHWANKYVNDSNNSNVEEDTTATIVAVGVVEDTEVAEEIVTTGIVAVTATDLVIDLGLVPGSALCRAALPLGRTIPTDLRTTAKPSRNNNSKAVVQPIRTIITSGPVVTRMDLLAQVVVLVLMILRHHRTLPLLL